MNRNDLLDIGRAITECPSWDWTDAAGVTRARYAPGMADHGRNQGTVGEAAYLAHLWNVDCVPDMERQSTIGALVGRLRRLYRDPSLCIACLPDGWARTSLHRPWSRGFASEADAVLGAFREAPDVELSKLPFAENSVA